MSNCILIADDEQDVLNLLGANLRAAGFRILTANDGPTALATARREMPALAVLDIMMPGISGLEVCREMKRQSATSAISVIVLSARTDEVDRILGFELGIDDYIVKPFSPRELVLRVKAILRRRSAPASTSEHLAAGRIALDRNKHSVTIDNVEVPVTAVEFKLLCAFMERLGTVLSRDELIARVWPAATAIELRTIDTHLRRLREKLGAAGDQLMTIRGFGYRLDA